MPISVLDVIHVDRCPVGALELVDVDLNSDL